MTTVARTRPALAASKLELNPICDVCGRARSTRKHQACSRTRQERMAVEWAAKMAELAAIRENKPRRFAR